MFDTFDRATVDDWLLSGEPIVRLYGRDFDMSVDRYLEWLLEITHMYGVEVQLKKMVDPPGVVVRTYMGEQPAKLVDPFLVVNPETCPWLFCTHKGCTPNRIADGMPPGSVCAEHIGAA